MTYSPSNPFKVGVAELPVLGKLQEADVLLFRRPVSVISRVIAKFGRSIYSHAAVVGWWDLDVMLMESREFAGARVVTLARGLTGEADVFRSEGLDDCQRATVVETMRRLAGAPYGWDAIWHCFLRHVPWARLFVPAQIDDTLNGHSLHCSAAVSLAYRLAGLDLVHNKPDFLTEPADLGCSAALDYQFTLVP
jgi:hypothetical protein